MASVRAFAIVDYGALASIMGPAGDGGRFLTRKMREAHREAERRTPVGPPRVGDGSHTGPGQLRRGNKRGGMLMRGPYYGEARLYNDVKYARYVHEGVPGKIFPRRGAFKIPYSSWVRYVPGSRSRVNKDGMLRWKNPVRGQGPQPWLREAVYAVMSRAA